VYESGQHFFRNVCRGNFLVRHAEDSQYPSGKGLQSRLRFAKDVPGLRLHHAALKSHMHAMWRTASGHTAVTR
jgi:hypothetical protein